MKRAGWTGWLHGKGHEGNFRGDRMFYWRRKWQPTPGFLPGELHRQRSLAGYSPWGRKESDMTEQLTLTHSECAIS